MEIKLDLARPVSSFESNSESTATIESFRAKKLNMSLELGIQVVDGKKISLINPKGSVNGRPMSSRLLNGFAVGISDRLNLDLLEQDGILARILQLEITEDKIELASFLKLETKSP
mgnify:CR=1 FL=1